MSGLPVVGSAERDWLERRAAAVRARVQRAPTSWKLWAESQLAGGELGRALGTGPVGDEVAGDWDQVRGSKLRASLGQVFTPRPLADLLARTLGLGSRTDSASCVVLDPACGAGSLLEAACRLRAASGWSTADAIAAVEGWDRDPVAAWLCRARLVEWALDRPRGPVPCDLAVRVVDALGDAGPDPRFGAVIGNPPYLEAKRMGRAEPGLRDRLKGRFPQLTGAFDLYLAFCYRSLELVVAGGQVALLVPNKICQGRYAKGFRADLLAAGPPSLRGLIDLSRMQPRPFPGTGVYPVVLHLERSAGGGRPFAARRVDRPEELAGAAVAVDPAAVDRVGGERPIFVPFEQTWADLAPLFSGTRLGEVAELLSACSFHAKGLRERFVSETRPSRDGRPYLGLLSRARRTEVAPWRVRWEGGWIRYDQQALKQEHRNPLPNLERTFLRPKLIWCQHGVRMRAVADPEGRWVTKDTYPVGRPTDPQWSLFRLTAVLNSTVFTALYNTVYQGIVVGGETYHYLPAFLRHVPVPAGDHPSLADLDDLVGRLQAAPETSGLWLEIDRRVADAYGIDEDARLRMVQTHLARVRAEVPG